MTDQLHSKARITDSHCHLDFPDFDGELDEVIARAHAAGVMRMVTICTKPRNEPTVRAIAEAHGGRLDVETRSERPEGAAFILRLPAAPAP